MQLKNVLRALLTLEVSSIAINVYFDRFLSSELPLLLKEYLAAEEKIGSVLPEYFLLIFVGFLIAYLVSIIGLFFIKNWAKWIYIIAGLVMLVLNAFTGPTVQHAAATSLDAVSSIAFGGVLILILFTKVLSVSKTPNGAPSKPE